MKRINFYKQVIISVIFYLYPCLLWECYAQKEITGQDTLITKGIIAVPVLQPKIKPKDISDSREKFIIESVKKAYCYTKALDERIKTIWDNDSKEKTMQHWNNQTWTPGIAYFHERFGKAEKYRRINRVKNHVEESLEWLKKNKITYKDKKKDHLYDEDRCAEAFMGLPRRIRLYNDFFKLSSEWEGGAVIVHELEHEFFITRHRHPSKEYKIESNTWEQASLKLAENNPKKAKLCPYCYQGAVKVIYPTCK